MPWYAYVLAAGVAISAFGALRQGQAAEKQGSFEKQQTNQQAKVTEQQAKTERVVAGQEEGDFRRHQSALMATRRAALGRAGIDPSTGSPLMATKDFLRETELQALRIRAGGEIRGTRLEQQATLIRNQGSLLQLAGKNAKTAGYLRAGSTLLTGLGTAFGMGEG
jgi:hypothetical protein